MKIIALLFALLTAARMTGTETPEVDPNNIGAQLLGNRYHIAPGRFFIQYWRLPKDSKLAPEDYFSDHLMTNEARQLSALITRNGEKFAVEIGATIAEDIYGDDVYWDGSYFYNHRRAKAELYAWPKGKRQESPAHVFLRTNTDLGNELLGFYIRLATKALNPELKVTNEPEGGNTREVTIANDEATLDITFLKLHDEKTPLLPLEFRYLNEKTRENAYYKNIFSTPPANGGDISKLYKGFYREVLISGAIVVDCFKVRIINPTSEPTEAAFTPQPKGFITVSDLRLGELVYYYSKTGILPLEKVEAFKKDPQLLSAHQRSTLPLKNN